ncbi:MULTISPECIES: DUF4367 domain-containing protein [Brevibacillus]|uniref:DUF4367 domain-containing protein n=1 Tax=Brevibacillus TaxID=55080 RepID=UPI001F60BE7C|nr:MULTISPECIES: DUF4367 domain-containing protein [Brevibacillus]
MKHFKKTIFTLLTLSLAGGTSAFADSVEHTLSGIAGTSTTYHSTVSDSSYAADYSYMHSDKIYEYGSNKIKFERAEAYAGSSSPSGSEFYNYQVVDVYGNGAGTKTQYLGKSVASGFTLTTGVTLYSTPTKAAMTRALVCADPSGCAGGQNNYVYDTWIYKAPSTLSKSKSSSDESQTYEVIEEHTKAKKVNMKEVKKSINYAEPQYVPEFMTVSDDVIMIEPPSVIEDEKLKDKLNQWEIRYKSTVDDSFINLMITKGGNGILGESEEIEINGRKGEIQESDEYITLSWKANKVSYWMVAKTTDKLTKEEVLKFAESIN